MTQKELQRVNEELKEKHYQALYDMLGGSTKVSRYSMARTLRRYECALRRQYLLLFEVDDVNGKIHTKIQKIKHNVCKYLASKFPNGTDFVNKNLVFNSDARGYSIKIEWNDVDRMGIPYRYIHIDWGGDGIVAPEPDAFFT